MLIAETMVTEFTDQLIDISDSAGFFEAIQTEEEYADAQATLRSITVLMDGIKATYEPIVKERHAVWKEATEERAQFINEVEGIQKTLKTFMAAYITRKDNEARSKAQSDLQREQESRDAEIGRLIKAGKADEANLLMGVSKVPDPETVKFDAKGSGARRIIAAEVFDLKALCKAVLDGVAREIAILPNMDFLNAQAKALGEKHFAIPGCRVKQDVNVSVRR